MENKKLIPPPIDPIPEMFRKVVSKVANIFKPAPPTDQILAEDAFRECPEAQPTDVELAEIRRIQANYEAAWRAANIEFTYAAARNAYMKQLADVREKAQSGVTHTNVRPFEHIALEFESKQLAAKHAIRIICEEGGAALAPVRDRFISAVEPYLARIEKSERADAEKLGLEWQPSARAAALRALLTKMKNSAKIGTYGSPQHVLPFLNLKLNTSEK